MNECFTDPIFGNFSVEKKRETRQVGAKEDRGEAKTEVSYSVSDDLQIT